MHSELGGRERKDEPAIARIDMLPTERVPERCPERIRFWGVKQNVGTNDPHRDLQLSVLGSRGHGLG
jgi:hypothetical protein